MSAKNLTPDAKRQRSLGNPGTHVEYSLVARHCYYAARGFIELLALKGGQNVFHNPGRIRASG